MIKEIHIKNFKSIYDLKISTTGLNLFIGENGSGKSNLLESLVFVSASQSNKLDNEFLTSRGIRVTSPSLMRSAFNRNKKSIDIKLTYNDMSNKEYKFTNQNKDYSEWIELNHINDNKKISHLKEYSHTIRKLLEEELVKSIIKDLKSTVNEDKIEQVISSFKNNKIDTVLENFEKKTTNITDKKIQELENNLTKNNKFKNFIIYSPENTALRVFEKEGQILPLGINGEGLLKLLKVINKYEDNTHMNDIISSLKLFNWFEDIKIPSDQQVTDYNILIKDKYLYKKFTQHSANEGFLFILFYITLVVAKETPSSFAIDNIDASLNPKLCTKLMTILSDLCKKYKKQIFLTTHNPAILDGVNLADDNQKLFVVSRNKQGYTRIKNITLNDKPKSSTNEPLKLSEAFLRGYLGGLPKGF